MTQEQKDLLLKDLCARLPYGVKGNFLNSDSSLSNDPLLRKVPITYSTLITANGNEGMVLNGDLKPYLFPLSSMTDEQERELEELDPEFYTIINDNGTVECVMNNKTFDWFHKHHFDWRGLIPMGLANDATGKNIY